MRAGLPVVASQAGGAAESVRDGETGIVVPPRCETALRHALHPLLVDVALRERLGAAGRRRYEETFTFDRMLAKTVTVYETVLGARRAGARQPVVLAGRRAATAAGSSG
jgi:glycosyltransferase involved in cell wall biosynthesis